MICTPLATSDSMEWVHTPEHEKLTPTRWKRELRSLNVDYEELPLITFGDPALVKLRDEGVEVNVGDVICITRKSRTFGEGSKYYRRVVYDF